MQLFAESMTERTNEKTVLTIGEIRTAIMTVQKILSNLSTPLHKAPTQTGDLEEKSKVWNANDLPTTLQLSISTTSMRVTMNLHAEAMVRTAN
jgi:hypothetical protein